jgi:hypothetical protein
MGAYGAAGWDIRDISYELGNGEERGGGPPYEYYL